MRAAHMDRGRTLISGGGIAGLTLAIALKRHGFDPVVIEREPALRREGYMMDFFGTGWDVAERMGLVERLRAVRYPIDALEFVDDKGEAYVHAPIARVRRALDDHYVYLRRPDLERILFERARDANVDIRFGTSLAALDDRGAAIEARFEDGTTDRFALAVGADGVHSRVRELIFGPERQFAVFLGLIVAAFHVPRGDFPIGRCVKLHEETDRFMFFYPLDERTMDATFVFRHHEDHVPQDRRAAFMREHLRGAGWIAEDVLRAYDAEDPMFFDSATQIAMSQWHRGRVALIGDACGCLTLLAGQGSHMAMAAGYLLAQELARHDSHEAAFAAYQDVLKPHVDKRRKDAARIAGLFVPTKRSHPWLRRLTFRAFFARPLIGLGLAVFGARSILPRRL
jgi:2-polyprenyl-6-methoxyphenol hydroxylase-like FAD-dependent oxidoreductase